MSVPTSQPLSNVVPVTVVFSAPGSPGLPFNQGLIVGNSGVLNSVTQRVQVFTSLTGMLQANFNNTDPEYLAAELYFGQSPAPFYLWVGCQDLTAIQSATVAATPATAITIGGNAGTLYAQGDTVSISGVTGSLVRIASISAGGVVTGVTLLRGGQGATVGNNIATTDVSSSGSGLTIDVTTRGTTGGTGYVLDDIVTVVEAGANGGQLLVTGVTAGAVTSLQTIVGSQGTAYSVAAGLPTTGGSGTGLDVNITAIGETPVQAVEACRAASYLWYPCMFVGSHQDDTATTNSDYEAIAQFIEAATPASQFFYTDGTSATLNGLSTSLPGALQGFAYRRSHGVYSTTQGGAAPNNIYACAAPMGLAMGLNTGTPGSYFSLTYKQLVGVLAEPLTQTNTENVCGTAQRDTDGLDCNVAVDYAFGAYVSIYQFATQASGNFFDEILQLDMLANNIQTTIFNFFTTSLAVPITDAGVTQIKNLVQQCCQTSQQIGFIAPSGTWQGVTIGVGTKQQIGPGTPLPSGYAIYAPSVNTLSAQQKANRQLPPITVLLIESGSGISQAVAVYVQP